MKDALREARIGIELSSARRPAVAVSLVGSVLVFIEPAETSRWVGFFQDTGLMLSVLSFAIAGSLYAIAGYHTASRGLAGAPESGRSVRSMGNVLRLRVVGDMTWLLSALMIVHAAAYARTAAASGSFSVMGWSATVLGLCSAALCYAFGLLAGSVLRRTWGLFVVAVVPYSLTLYTNAVVSQDVVGQPFARLLAPYIDQTWGPSLVPYDPAILLLAAYCALTAAALAAAAGFVLRLRAGHAAATVRLPRAGALPLAGAVAAGAIVATSFTANDYFQFRTEGYACDPEGRVCAWERNSRENLQTWIAGYEAVQNVLGDIPRGDLRFAEYLVPVDGDWIELGPPPGRLTIARVAGLMLPEYTSRIAQDVCAAEDAAVTGYELIDVLSRALGSADPADAQDQARQLLDACG